MKIFVTGASGFVGGAACKALIAAGHQVLAMSRTAKSDVLLAYTSLISRAEGLAQL